MTTGDVGGPPRSPSLRVLSRCVRDARAEVRQFRHGTAAAKQLADARRALVIALEDYTVALEQCHLPVPSALRSELQLHRDLFDR